MALTRLRASNISEGDYKSSCRVCTATDITLSGGAPNSVDDISLSKFDRILVKSQSIASQNGIYRVSTVGTGSNGTWIRDIDAKTNNSISAGSIVYVESGVTCGGRFFYLTTTGSVVIGTTELSFSDLLGSVATTAISNGNSNVSVAANSNVTVSVAGNSNILTVTGTGANINGTGNVTGNLDVGGNLTLAGNLTVNGTTTTINSTTLTVDDLNIVLASGAASAAAANGAGITIDGANATLNYISASNTWTFDRGVTVTGTANITGNANVGNLGTSGNITAGFYIGNGSQLTGIVSGGGATFTASASAPVSAEAGDYWYETDTDVLYIYVNDGTSNFWLDIISFPSQLLNGNSNIAIAANGNVTVSVAGTSNVVNVQTSNVTLKANLLPDANVTYNLGSTSLRWANVFGVSSSALYADLAEKYQSDNDYTPGTVVVFGGATEITVTTISHDTRVAGVISTAPAYLMNDDNHSGIWLPVALTGRVPTKVKGPVGKGDLVVASDQSGVAIKIDQQFYNPGCVIGKSLEVINDDSVNVIEVVIGRF
jgi:uncharacterized protein YuzE